MFEFKWVIILWWGLFSAPGAFAGDLLCKEAIFRREFKYLYLYRPNLTAVANNKVETLDLDASGNRLAVGYHRGAVALFDFERQEVKWLRQDGTNIQNFPIVRFMKPNVLLHSAGSVPWRLEAFETDSGKKMGEVIAEDSRDTILAISPDGSKFVSSDNVQHIFKEWRIRIGNEGITTDVLAEWKSADIYSGPSHQAAFSPDGNFVAFEVSAKKRKNGCQHRVLLFNVAPDIFSNPLPFFEVPRDVRSLAIRLQGDVMAVGSIRKELYLCDTSPTPSEEPIKTLHEEIPDGFYLGETNALAFSPDGKILAAGTPLGKILLFDAVTGETLSPPLARAINYAASVTALKFSLDGKYLFVGDFTGKVFRFPVELFLKK